MEDAFTREERSRIMSRIRSKNTKPEISARSGLHRRGLRFRLHQKDIPGSPDIVLKKHRALVFVHGCFWHQHRGCGRAVMPKSNRDYWRPKLTRNIERFEEVRAVLKLKKAGWRVFVLWECEAGKPREITKLAGKIRECEDGAPGDSRRKN